MRKRRHLACGQRCETKYSFTVLFHWSPSRFWQATGSSLENLSFCNHSCKPTGGSERALCVLKTLHLCSRFKCLAASYRINRFSRVQPCATLWTVACQAPLSVGFSILEWAAMPFSRVSSPPRDPTHLSYISLLHWQEGSLPLAPPGKPI